MPLSSTWHEAQMQGAAPCVVMPQPQCHQAAEHCTAQLNLVRRTWEGQPRSSRRLCLPIADLSRRQTGRPGCRCLVASLLLPQTDSGSMQRTMQAVLSNANPQASTARELHHCRIHRRDWLHENPLVGCDDQQRGLTECLVQNAQSRLSTTVLSLGAASDTAEKTSSPHSGGRCQAIEVEALQRASYGSCMAHGAP